VSVVTVRDLRVVFAGANPVVDGVSFSIEAGECLAIVGESGSGKTLTANSLLGFVPDGAAVSATELTIDGVSATHFTEADWRRIRGTRVGLVSQDALVALDPLRRVGAEVTEAIEVRGRLSRAERTSHAIDLLGRVAVPEPALRERQYPHELSGGLRQRALIASALAAAPGLLIADEPTTALDATVQARILALLADLKASGLAVLLVSHDLSVVASLADRIAVMQNGRIVETAAAATLLRDPQHPYTRALLAAVPGERVPAPEPGPVVLEARGLSKSYRGPRGSRRLAVDDVSLSLRGGTTLGVVGESGSGKSTLARLLMALESPDAGEVLVDAAAWSTLPEKLRRPRRPRIQLIEQDPLSSFDPRLTVARILAEAIAASAGEGLDRTEAPEGSDRARSNRARSNDRARPNDRARDLLEQVGLGAEHLGRRPHQLSGGQRQRVAIARALALRPEILVCDEPVSALDVSVQAQVLALLDSLQREHGLSLVLVSHDLAVIRSMSDEIAVMQDGRVVESGPAAGVLGDPRHPFTIELLASLPSTTAS